MYKWAIRGKQDHNRSQNRQSAREFGMTVDIRKVDIIPVCPFCEKEVDELVEVKRTGWFTVNRVFCCPHYRKIVGLNAGTNV